MSIVQHLVVDGFGVHVGKYSERLKVTQKGETLTQAPLLHLQTVTLLNLGISLSADAIECCAERGIPIFFLDGQGNLYATLYAAGLAATVITRREQLRAYDDARGVKLGKAFAGGKIVNQSTTRGHTANCFKSVTVNNSGADCSAGKSFVAWNTIPYLDSVAPLGGCHRD